MGMVDAVPAVTGRRCDEAGRRHVGAAEGRVTPRVPMQGGGLDSDEMQFPGTGVDNGQDEGGAGHAASPHVQLRCIGYLPGSGEVRCPAHHEVTGCPGVMQVIAPGACKSIVRRRRCLRNSAMWV